MRTNLPLLFGVRIIFAYVAALGFVACPGRRGLTPPSSSSPTPMTTRLPETFIPFSRMDTAQLFNGLQLHSKVTAVEGPPAVIGRKTPDAYRLDLGIKIQIPKAAQAFDELSVADPDIGVVLPGLKEQLIAAKVSNFYHGLYQLKVDSVNRLLTRLDQIVSRRNFFDCNTILEIQDARTSRKALLIQSDMNVNADGSDADRQTEVDGSPTNFQPYTSYRWLKKTNKPSQFLPEREAKLKQLRSDYGATTTSANEKKAIKKQIHRIQREIADLKKYSYLISKHDPYVVLPGFMLRQSTHPYVPKLGDYVVVIYQGKLYPSLLGDVGPSYKIGEASLRICMQLDPRSNAYNRPASNLNITYLVFPGSADSIPGPPNLKKLHDRCATLLTEIGGYNGELWEWEDLLVQPSPSPTVLPQLSIAPRPSPSPKPSANPSPSASSWMSGTLAPAAKESEKKRTGNQ